MSQSGNFLEQILVVQQQKKDAGQVARTEGNKFFQEGQLDKAIEAYTLAIDTYPVDAASHSNRAWCHFKLENFEQTIFDADKALDIDPSFVKAYHRRGKANMELGFFDRAVNDFEHCLRQNPRDQMIANCLDEACQKLEEKLGRGPSKKEVPTVVQEAQTTIKTTQIKPKKEITKVVEKDNTGESSQDNWRMRGNRREGASSILDNWLRTQQQRAAQYESQEQESQSSELDKANERQKDLERQMAELDSKRDKLIKEAQEAAEVVKRAQADQKKAENEAQNAQSKLQNQGDAIEATAHGVASEIVDKNITEEELQEQLMNGMMIKAQKEDEQYQEWERQQELSKVASENHSIEEIEQYLLDFKTKGNDLFKAKKLEQAITHFTDGINFYIAKGAPTDSEGIKTKATQLFTNRSLAYHQLDEQEKALESASYVLDNLDPSNFKALMRRSFANRAALKFQAALADLVNLRQLLDQADPAIKEVTQLIDSCQKGIDQESPNKSLTQTLTDMPTATVDWIKTYKDCRDHATKITYLKRFAQWEITDLFQTVPIPLVLFSDFIAAAASCESVEDLMWAGKFIIYIQDTHEFDKKVLSCCREADKIRMENLGRKLQRKL